MMEHYISEKVKAPHMSLATGRGPDQEANFEFLPVIDGFGDWYGEFFYILRSLEMARLYFTLPVE